MDGPVASSTGGDGSKCLPRNAVTVTIGFFFVEVGCCTSLASYLWAREQRSAGHVVVHVGSMSKLGARVVCKNSGCSGRGVPCGLITVPVGFLSSPRRDSRWHVHALAAVRRSAAETHDQPSCQHSGHVVCIPDVACVPKFES